VSVQALQGCSKWKRRELNMPVNKAIMIVKRMKLFEDRHRKPQGLLLSEFILTVSSSYCAWIGKKGE
jgi:hypothetical protein